MAIDILAVHHHDTNGLSYGVEASYIVAYLCREAGVCCYQEDYRPDVVQLGAALCDVVDGLRVKDAEGNWFRLRVTAEPLGKNISF